MDASLTHNGNRPVLPQLEVLYAPIYQELNQQETRLEALRKEIAEIESKREVAAAKLNQMIQQLSFDEKL